MGKKKRSKRRNRAGYPAVMENGAGGLAGLRGSEQFILGALIGAAAVYMLGDEALRGKLIKTGLRLYSGIAGSFEEMKEQVADIQAEMAAEQQGEA